MKLSHERILTQDHKISLPIPYTTHFTNLNAFFRKYLHKKMTSLSCNETSRELFTIVDYIQSITILTSIAFHCHPNHVPINKLFLKTMVTKFSFMAKISRISTKIIHLISSLIRYTHISLDNSIRTWVNECSGILN